MSRGIFTIYLVIIVLSPLLFGAVHTYAYTLVALGVCASTLILLTTNIRKNFRTGIHFFSFPRTCVNFVFFSLLALLVFQVVPMPRFLLSLLSPEAIVVGQKSLPASASAFGQSPTGQWYSLAPYYYPVRVSMIRFTTYGLFFLGLVQVLNSKKRIEMTILLILTLGCFEAIYGLAQAYSGTAKIWWFHKMRYQADVTGTYINRNHLAGFMEMCLLLAAAYSAGISTRNYQRKGMPQPTDGLGSRIARYVVSGEKSINKRILALFCGVVAGLGLIFSASRGGIIAAAGGMLCMSLLFTLRRNHRRKGLVLFCLFGAILLYASLIGVEYPLERFKFFDRDFEARSRYTQKTMNIFRDYPLTGIGLGNFTHVYPKYQAAEDKKTFIQHAHNDWAEFLAEGGIIGFCLLIAGSSYVIYRFLITWKERRDPFSICVGISPLPVMTAVAIHAYSDFNLHIPANFLMLSAILAIGWSALRPRRSHGADKADIGYYKIPLKYRGTFFLALFLGLIFWTGYWTVRHFIAEAFCNTVTNSTLNRDQNPPLAEIRKAIVWDKSNAQYWHKLARELRRIQDAELSNPDVKMEDSAPRRMEPIRALERAVQLNPFCSEYHRRLGFEYTYMWRDPNYHEKWLPAADLSMERAAYFAGEKNPRLHVELGNYWVMRSKTFYPEDPGRESSWIKACWHYKTAQRLEMKEPLKDEILKYVTVFYPDPKIARDAIVGE